jgi:hypothetical protein
MVRIGNKIPMDKIDVSKYDAEKPEGDSPLLISLNEIRTS